MRLLSATTALALFAIASLSLVPTASATPTPEPAQAGRTGGFFGFFTKVNCDPAHQHARKTMIDIGVIYLTAVKSFNFATGIRQFGNRDKNIPQAKAVLRKAYKEYSEMAKQQFRGSAGVAKDYKSDVDADLAKIFKMDQKLDTALKWFNAYKVLTFRPSQRLSPKNANKAADEWSSKQALAQEQQRLQMAQKIKTDVVEDEELAGEHEVAGQMAQSTKYYKDYQSCVKKGSGGNLFEEGSKGKLESSQNLDI